MLKELGDYKERAISSPSWSRQIDCSPDTPIARCTYVTLSSNPESNRSAPLSFHPLPVNWPLVQRAHRQVISWGVTRRGDLHVKEKCLKVIYYYFVVVSKWSANNTSQAY